MSKTNNHGKVYIHADGERVMRITEIIRVLAKDQITTWANMLGLHGIEYKQELDRTANIGTMVHALIEDSSNRKSLAMLDFGKYGVNDPGSRMEVMNAIRSFSEWYDDVKRHYKYEIVFTEKELVGKRFGGTIDCAIKGFRDPDKIILVDYKTNPGFYLSQYLQLAGYVTIYEELYGKDTVEGIMVVLADKKGNKGRAKIIYREKLDPFMVCFECLYNTALATKVMNQSWWRATELIE